MKVWIYELRSGDAATITRWLIPVPMTALRTRSALPPVSVTGYGSLQSTDVSYNNESSGLYYDASIEVVEGFADPRLTLTGNGEFVVNRDAVQFNGRLILCQASPI